MIVQTPGSYMNLPVLTTLSWDFILLCISCNFWLSAKHLEKSNADWGKFITLMSGNDVSPPASLWLGRWVSLVRSHPGPQHSCGWAGHQRATDLRHFVPLLAWVFLSLRSSSSALPSQTRLKPLFHRKEGRGLYTGLHTPPTPVALSLPRARARRQASVLSADWSPPDICGVCGGSPVGGPHPRGLASSTPGDSVFSHQFALGDSHHAESEWGSSWVVRCPTSVQVSKCSHPSSPCP